MTLPDQFMKRMLNNWLFLGLLAITIVGCKENYTPKPKSYFRIGLPERAYLLLEGEYPYKFEIPVYSRISRYAGKYSGSDTSEYWINVEFPQFHGRLYITYKPVVNNLAKLVDDAHAFAYKHSVRADAISQREFQNPANKVFGVLFDIKGNTASSYQFYMTDSTRNFLRGALYFDTEPNKDSLAPVNEFLLKDIERLIETLAWKKQI